VKVFITVAVIVVVVLGLLVGAGVWIHGRMKVFQTQATKVRLESPTRGELVEVVSAPGEIEPRTKVSISARLSARIVELPYEEGDRVTKGDPKSNPPTPLSVLVRLDATDLEASLRSAEARRAAQAAAIEVAKADVASQQARVEGITASLAEAQRDLKRQEALLASGDVSRSVYDQAKCRVDELSAQLSSAEHTLKSQRLNLPVMEYQLAAADAEIAQARDKLSYTTITSPIDGVVTRLNAEVGELVVTGTMNNPGTVIMEVADLSKMVVVARVDESDIGSVEPGQRAVVRIRAYPEEEFEGVVHSIGLIGGGTGTASREFEVEILLKAGGRRIYSRLSADVDIETRRHGDVLKVPSQAVLGRRVDDLPTKIREGDPNLDAKKTFATVVYRCKDGKAVVTPVTIGPSDATHTVILAGLDQADRVVVGPYKVLENLKHDQRIQDEREGAASQPAGTQPAQSRPAETRPAQTQVSGTGPGRTQPASAP